MGKEQTQLILQYCKQAERGQKGWAALPARSYDPEEKLPEGKKQKRPVKRGTVRHSEPGQLPAAPALGR
jgi:hypothetical protein